MKKKESENQTDTSLENVTLPFSNYSTNLLLRDSAFDVAFNEVENPSKEEMTFGGVVNKMYFLVLITILSARLAYLGYQDVPINTETSFLAVSLLSLWAAVCVGFFAFFFKNNTKYIAPLSAIFLGLAIAPLAVRLESTTPGIVIITLTLTLGIFEGIILLYQFIANHKMRIFWIGVIGALFGIIVLYVSIFVLNLFQYEILYPHQGNVIYAVPLIIVLFGSLFTMIANVEFVLFQIVKKRPAELEWYSAFALYISIIWLYVDIILALKRRS